MMPLAWGIFAKANPFAQYKCIYVNYSSFEEAVEELKRRRKFGGWYRLKLNVVSTK